jgi:cytochrome c peroxidase
VDAQEPVRASRWHAVTVRALATIAVIVAASLAVVLQAAGPRLPLGLDLYRPTPADNPLTVEKATLGRRLFFDRRLSRDGSLSCASCHDPRRAFANQRPVARGVGGARGDRNVPTLVNRAWGRSFFWDGRAATLEEQALEPVFNRRELAATEANVMTLIDSADYRNDFRAAFRRDPDLPALGRALASFVRTIVSGNAPYDRHAAGISAALGASAKRGLMLFTGPASCHRCHTGPVFSDDEFHNTGVAWRRGHLTDPGRAAVTKEDVDRGAFKTPTLREIARTAPYMHDGSIRTLEEVIDFYDRGGSRNPGLDPRLRALHLTARDKLDLVAFLESLSGDISHSQ